jgi:DNA ligase-1
MDTIRKSPVLRSTAKTGKAKYWQLQLLHEPFGDSGSAEYYLHRLWWQDGSVIQESTPERVEGKNWGRSNATTAEQQANLEFDALVKKRRDKGYSESGHSDHGYTKPMLAHVFADRVSTIKWPVYVQPKLDGFRMLMDGDNAWTRGGKDHVEACVQHLMWDVGELTVDGELLLPGNRPLQETNSAAKKFRRGSSDTLEYHVYDIVEPSLSFAARWELLKDLFEKPHPKNVKLVPTVMVDTEAEVMTAHGVFTRYGYEGSIIRSADGRYEIGHRSYSLLKLKDFQDAEFQVVGVEHGKGSFEDKAILVLEAKPGVTFNAVPQGNDEYRRSLWTNREDLLGQWWTIKYQTLSKEGKPVFPVAIGPRKEGE